MKQFLREIGELLWSFFCPSKLRQRMKFPGLSATAQRATPQMAADSLYKVENSNALVQTASNEHPYLPILVPASYPQSSADDEESLPPVIGQTDGEIGTVLPNLQRIAREVERVLESPTPALVERGLDRCIENLGTLQSQLSGLGLKQPAIKRWTPVIARWREVLDGERTYQRTLTHGEIVNPFYVGNSLQREQKDLFKGRGQFVAAVLRLVLDQSRPTLVLHGPRRCGKSSFLFNLPRLLPSDTLPIYLSMQKQGIMQSEADFCYGLARAVRDGLRSQGITAPTLQRSDFDRNHYLALEEWLEAVQSIIESRHLLLCLDEFESLGQAIGAGKLSFAIFDELREFIQHSQMAFLFCGMQTLDELGPDWSNYFINVQPVEMTYLEPDEARELLNHPDPSYERPYDDAIVEQVLALTRCQPYLLQLMGAEMVRQVNQQSTRMLTPPLLEAAIQAALGSGAPYFTNVWRNDTGTTPDERQAGQRILHAVAHEQPLPAIESEPARTALCRLVRYHVIERSGGGDGYRCEVPLVARWVRERGERTER